MILLHGRENQNQRTVCNLSISNCCCCIPENRAVVEKPNDADEKFDTYRNLQRHRAVLLRQHGFLVADLLQRIYRQTANMRYTRSRQQPCDSAHTTQPHSAMLYVQHQLWFSLLGQPMSYIIVATCQYSGKREVYERLCCLCASCQ